MTVVVSITRVIGMLAMTGTIASMMAGTAAARDLYSWYGPYTQEQCKDELNDKALTMDADPSQRARLIGCAYSPGNGTDGSGFGGNAPQRGSGWYFGYYEG
ncbi:MAG: hypothetical protein JWN03_6139 [Nocardia sp.]|nr:hypothetical protein [Nocardia sp.]